MQLFPAELLAVIEHCKQPKCLSVGSWVKHARDSLEAGPASQVWRSQYRSLRLLRAGWAPQVVYRLRSVSRLLGQLPCCAPNWLPFMGSDPSPSAQHLQPDCGLAIKRWGV